MSDRFLVVNADDLGYAAGVNRGIAEAHARGVVTSASLLVDGPAAADAADVAREDPALAIGLHLDLDDVDPDAVPRELERQLARFRALLGRDPTHVDSHHHVHRAPHALPHARALAGALGVPLRGDPPVAYLGDLTPAALDRVRDGWAEVSCHPGYVSPDLRSSYREEREEEVRALTDPRLRAEIEARGIVLSAPPSPSRRSPPRPGR